MDNSRESQDVGDILDFPRLVIVSQKDGPALLQ